LEFKKIKTMKLIDFIDPPEHINKYLTHWTGRDKNDQDAFDILTKIIDTKELKFSRNEISFPNAHTTITQLMVCFTDTPIRQSVDHCKTYGYFGVSFNKHQLTDYGASPVFYIVDNRRQHQNFLQNIRFDNNEQSSLISWISGMTQPFNTSPTNPNHYAEFYEREWRISRVLPFFWISIAEQSQGPHNEYPFKGNIQRRQIGTNKNNEEFFLPFEPAIIENIIVPTDYEEQTIELIKKNKLDIELLITTKKT